MSFHPLEVVQPSDYDENSHERGDRRPPSSSFSDQPLTLEQDERRKRTGLKAILTLVTVMCLFFLIAWIKAKINLGTAEDRADAAEAAVGQVCQTEECVVLAASLIESMDLTVDPCEDFYTYSCGKWDANHPIPEDKSRWGSFDVLSDDNKLILRRALEDSPTTQWTIEEQARTFYSDCMDTTTIDTKGNTPIVEILNELRLSWLPENQDTTVWTTATYEGVTRSLNVLDNYGISGFIETWVNVDAKNSSKYSMYLGQSGLGLPSPEYYIDTDTTIKDAYIILMSDYFNLFDELKVLNTTQIANEIFLFEAELASFHMPKADMRDPNSIYNKYDMDNLLTLTSMPLKELYFQPKYADISNVATIIPDIIIETMEYLNNIDIILLHHKPSTVQHYLFWRLLLHTSNYLSTPFQELYLEFEHILYGVNAVSDRWKTCTSMTDASFGFVTGKMFVDEVFAGDSKTIAEDMIMSIKQSFKDNLPYLTWMDDETRVLAAEKCDSFTDKIGYPDWMLNEAELMIHYDGFIPINGEYFQTIMNYRIYEVRTNYDQIRLHKIDTAQWEMTPATVNAYYEPSYNEIVFPAGIMQKPFFKKGFPTSYNYGGLGVVMGHEITHGFDDEGSQYDKDGNLIDWWNSQVRNSFEEAVQCISKQYSSYEFFGLNINGNLTLGENIADNGGLKESFHAYRGVSNSQSEPFLPGVSLNHDQLFFVGFAQVWCGSVREEEAIRRIYTDPHSPGRYRVIGTVSNSVDFANAFQCKSNTPMNPSDKCTVW